MVKELKKEMLKKVSKSDGTIQEIGRVRAEREKEFNELIDKIGFLITKSHFTFKVYDDNQGSELTLFMRIYEPGGDEGDEFTK